jgi:hypothetical protein
MKELWLNFKDENGEAKRVLVEGEKFAIGRTPDNDLPIPLGNLSRQHAKIERFADVFVASDCDSSNGTKLNGELLKDPAAIKHGDKLNLGDAVEIEIEIPADKDKAKAAGGDVSPAPKLDDEDDEEIAAFAPAVSSASGNAAAASGSSGSSGMLWLLLIAPIFLVMVLIGLGGAILVVRSQKDTEVVKNENIYPTPTEDDFPSGNDNKKTPEKETPTPTATPVSSPGGTSTPANSTTPTPAEEPTSTPKPTGDSEKIKFASAPFLRLIANDPRVFLRDQQVLVLTPKINQFKGSSALGENIRNARKNSAQIKSIAESHNLRPQFLAVAALTQLGNQKGDVVAVANQMVGKLSEIFKGFGIDSADDALLIIAAYHGDKTGNNLQTLVSPFISDPNKAQTFRSIWFLKDKGKLTNSEFDFALQFLAIGTITQNPKEFNVSAEALVF